jgi:GNAT superfamily N-acetyltransferase
MTKATRRNRGRYLKLRRATTRDIDILVHQRRGMWFDMGERNPIKLGRHDRAFRRWVQPRLRRGTVVGWLIEAEREGIVAGAIVWLRPSIGRPGVPHLVQPFLLSMYTEPQWRRQGLASRIVEEAVKWTRKNDYRGLWLHASLMGRRLYVRRGFKRTWEMMLEL